MLYALFCAIGIVLIVYTAACITEFEFWPAATSLIVAIVLFAVSINGIVWIDDKNYAKKEFKAGEYQVDIEAVIENCNDDADTLALHLMDEGISRTVIIEPNISKRDIEYVCTIPKDSEDIRVYIDSKEMRKMIKQEYISLIPTSKEEAA